MQISRVRFWLRRLHTRGVCNSLVLRRFGQTILYRNVQFEADPKVLALRDKLVYCDYLDRDKVRMGYKRRQKLEIKKFKLAEKERYENTILRPAFSVMLNNQREGENETEFFKEKRADGIDENMKERKIFEMPYAIVDSYEITDSRQDDTKETSMNSLNEEYKDLYEKYLNVKKSGSSGNSRFNFESFKENDGSNHASEGKLEKVPDTWMTDYEEFDDTSIDINLCKSYGTSDPDSKVSSVPCGGCGALLHCKDPSIAGYLPTELFSYKNDEDLKSMICQRCHFLKFYNTALEVNVSTDDYPKLLRIVKSKKCAIVLIIDLTDFPCSIWPDLKSIMHPFTPIYLVGNKVDLLPKDSALFIDKAKELLLDTVVNVTGVKRANITHVQLTSAKTGYGVEQLINKLQYKWRYKGDVYLVGCTNVGKSSLFNALLNSDYCKIQAVDLVQRATVSAWPGTTLSLLKFPILNPTDEKRWLRIERLKKEQFYRTEELNYRNYQFKTTGKMEFATLAGDVGRTFRNDSKEKESNDLFSEKSHTFMSRKLAFDESRPEYEQSRWCYDTPGTVQRDQILDLLTTDELLLTLPQRIVSPRTFILKPKQTVFVAGMGRLDYLEGEYFIRCTLFASNELPLTMCYTIDADEIYDRLLETKAFVVPTNDPERLKVWPKLKSSDMKITGVENESAADVVLSNAGWIAVTPNGNESASLRAWTPQGRGICLRCPALLRKSVRLRGRRVAGTPMYLVGRRVYVKC